MGLFDFLKGKKAKQAGDVLLAMPLFNKGQSYEIYRVIEHLRTEWKLTVTRVEGDDQTATFSIYGETIALAAIPARIPWGDIQGTARYAYNWPTAEQDLADHTGHALITVMTRNASNLDRFKVLTMVIDSVLGTTKAAGVYQGAQSLLVPRDQYLDGADVLRRGKLPVDLWVYLGLRQSEAGNSVYTVGLNAFGKQEMEMVESKNDLASLHGLMLNVCAYVVGSDVTFKSGETMGYTADQKIKITSSKGVFVQGETLKLQL